MKFYCHINYFKFWHLTHLMVFVMNKWQMQLLCDDCIFHLTLCSLWHYWHPDFTEPDNLEACGWVDRAVDSRPKGLVFSSYMESGWYSGIWVFNIIDILTSHSQTDWKHAAEWLGQWTQGEKCWGSFSWHAADIQESEFSKFHGLDNRHQLLVSINCATGSHAAYPAQLLITLHKKAKQPGNHHASHF